MSETKTILVDGLSVVTTDAGAQAITKLQRQISDATTAATAAATAHTAAIAAKDADLAKRDATIDDLKAKVLDAAALDARVQSRGDLVAMAKAIHDGDYRGMSDADVRKAAVIGKLGDASVKDKADAYVEARFDILADSVKTTDPVVRVLGDGVSRVSANDAQSVEDQAYQRSVDRFNRKKEA